MHGIGALRLVLLRPQRFLTMAGLRAASSFIMDKAFIDGKWIPADNGQTFPVVNPASGELLGVVPDMGRAETERAIQGAHIAFSSWKKTTAKEKGAILIKWYALMKENLDELAKLLTLENGKPLAESKGEMSYAADFVEWYAAESRRVYGDTINSPSPSKRMVIIKQPIGVAGMITPWNFPMAMVTRKAAPAIAAGCPVVLKPAEDTPLSALALCKLAEEAGFPPGLLNVVTASREKTPEVGKMLCEHPLVRTISFTGSTAIGKILLQQSASTVKRVSLELGGNAAFIVFNSADVDRAVAGAMACKFRTSGQTCVCANRILVQDGVYGEFIQKFAAAAEQLTVGDGLTVGTTQGPLINVRAVEKVEGHLKDAVSHGAKVVLGGSRHSLGGSFFQPTIVSEVTTDMLCAREETFGPLAAIMRFKTEEEAVSIANATQSGLAGYFFSNDIGQIWRVAEELEVGLVGINEGIMSTAEAPFGGVKESGLGREGGKYGIEEFLETKYLCFGGI